MKLPITFNICLSTTTHRWKGESYYGEMVFTNRDDFEKMLRFFRDIKRSLYEQKYQWKFYVLYSAPDLVIRIENAKGVTKDEGVVQCLEWLKGNIPEVHVNYPELSESSSLVHRPF